MAPPVTVPSSYRDPAGFVIEDEGLFKRVITRRGVEDYELYITSGLHSDLVRRSLVVDHVEEPPPPGRNEWVKLLIPEQIRYISYPYEWSFDQLRDAALLTLEIQELALARGMSLKDASAYNIQFRGPRPVFIDTLSFEAVKGGAWPAYEQFCRHFLGPLLVMSYRAPAAGRLLKADLQGFPIDRVSRLLPRRSYLAPGPLLHIHLHARAISRNSSAKTPVSAKTAGGMAPLIRSLRRAVERIRRPAYPAAWTRYYAESRFYPPGAQQSKQEGVAALASQVKAGLVFDIGANTGFYSRMVAEEADCVAFDSDPACVNELYLQERERDGSRILPLVMDLANPTPALGFELKSTMSLFDRPKADLVLCLALIHHLRVSANLPFRRIAECLARLGKTALVEFVPLTDPAVSSLTSRWSDFNDYHTAGFLGAFLEFFELCASRGVAGAGRRLYLFARRP